MIKGLKTGLRALEKADLEQLRDWRNNETFRRNFREFRELNMVNQETWFEKINNSQTDYMFGITDLASDELIGAAGLLYINWTSRFADFSFYIGKNQAYIDNEGYAACAAKNLIHYAFGTLNLNKIWMELYEFDQVKIDFFTKQLPFKIDGKLRENVFADGRYHDSFILSLLRKEFAN